MKEVLNSQRVYRKSIKVRQILSMVDKSMRIIYQTITTNMILFFISNVLLGLLPIYWLLNTNTYK